MAPVIPVAFLALAGLTGPASRMPPCDSALKRTGAQVHVYDAPPTFSTGRGWTLGRLIATLASGTAVTTCETRSVGLLGASKPWVRIRFDLNGARTDGWISGEGTLAAARSGWRILSASFAPDTSASSPPDVPSAWPTYAVIFLAVLLGMVAKGVFDRWQHGDRFDMRAYLRKTAPSLVVSPIVFLTFNQVGDFTLGSAHSVVVYLCMAFQNGFFWQTVLVRAGGKA